VRGGIGMAVSGRVSKFAGLSPELSLRAGLIDRLDVGIKTTFQSLEGQVKGQLVRGDFDLSLALCGALNRDVDDHLFGESSARYQQMRIARLMVLAGQRLADSIDLVLMGDGQYGVRGGTQWHEHFVGVGGGLGVLLKGRAQFLPEIVVTQFVKGEAPAHPGLQAGDTRIQFTVTGLVGGNDDERAR
jgi:hypothetical protein